MPASTACTQCCVRVAAAAAVDEDDLHTVLYCVFSSLIDGAAGHLRALELERSMRRSRSAHVGRGAARIIVEYIICTLESKLRRETQLSSSCVHLVLINYCSSNGVRARRSHLECCSPPVPSQRSADR